VSKASFSLPQAGEFFDSVSFVQLDEKHAKELVCVYNIEGPESRMQAILRKRAKYDDEKSTKNKLNLD
jgi:hypothetical protein